MRALTLALFLALFLAAALPALAAHCESDCKVRVSACRVDEPARCTETDIFPEAGSGLCNRAALPAAVAWIIDQHQKQRVDWTLKGAACVNRDDRKV